MQQKIYFKSEGHKERFLAALADFEKIRERDGYIDVYFGACFYILTSDEGLWRMSRSYVVDQNTIKMAELLGNGGVSGGEFVLIKWAWHLFTNGHGPDSLIDALDFLRLDESNFKVALMALAIRFYEPRLAEFEAWPEV